MFDIEMENFRKKACLVMGGYMTQTPDVITCSGVITRESVHIAPTIAAFHNLKIKASEVLNTSVTTPKKGKTYLVLGLELGMMLVSLPLLSEHYKVQ